jgi:predicted phage terminase large subunit-like protein
MGNCSEARAGRRGDDSVVPLVLTEELGRVAAEFREDFAREHGERRRLDRGEGKTFGLLDWGTRYLPGHFSAPPSDMHRWLARQVDAGAGEGVRPTGCFAREDACDGSAGRESGDESPHSKNVVAVRQRTATGQESGDESPHSKSLKLNLLGPRGSAKSTLASLALPLRAAVERREPYIWIVSDTAEQAAGHLANIKAELEDNRALAAAYPAAVGLGPVWRRGLVTLRNGVTIEALGTGQRIRGRRRREHRPTLIICDDLQNDQHIRSAVQRQRSRAWFEGALLKAGTLRTSVLNLATALHREALGLVLHRTPGWTSRVFRSIVRWPENMSLWQEWEAIFADVANPRHRPGARAFYEAHREAMHAGAIVLWPAVEDLYTLMSMRVESGRTAFEREKQNSPINPDLCEWPEAYFDEGIWFQEWPDNLVVRTMALDPSKGADARRGDYSALVMLGVDRQGILYVEADLARRPTPELVAAATEWHRRFRPDVFAVEANQFQDLLVGQFEAEFRRQAILAARPVAMENRTAKEVRIRRLGPYLSSRRFRFRATSPATRLLVEQLEQFPIADHDDGPDALEMALRLAIEVINGRAFDDGLGSRLPVGM